MMTRTLIVSLVLTGCEGIIGLDALPPLDDATEAFDEREPDPTEVDEDGTPYVPGPRAVPKLPGTAVCQAAPTGRGYRGLGGEPLEFDRSDVAPLVDTHRTFRNVVENSGAWTVISEVTRALGAGASSSDPELKDPGVGAAFGVTPRSWFEESEVGAFAVYVTFQYAFKACGRAFDTHPTTLKAGWFEHTAHAPTPDRARAFCERTQRAAWMKEPLPAEVAACEQLALELPEPDVKKCWAYVCASVFASPNFLAN